MTQGTSLTEQQLSLGSKVSSMIGKFYTTGVAEVLVNNQIYKGLSESTTRVVTSLLDDRMISTFKENMNIFEKLGFINPKKLNRMKMKMKLIHGGLDTLINAGFALVPFIVDHYFAKRQALKMVDFTTGAFAYINGKPNVQSQIKVIELGNKLHIAFNGMRYNQISSEYMGANCNALPYLQSDDDSAAVRTLLFSLILGAVDLSEAKSLERAKQIGELLSIPSDDIETDTTDFHESLVLTSDALGFSAMSMSTIVSNLIPSVQERVKYSNYCIDNDSFFDVKAKRKKVLETAGAITLAGTTFFTGPIVDALLVSALPLVNNMISKGNISASNVMNIYDNMYELKTRYNEIKKPNADGASSGKEEF